MKGVDARAEAPVPASPAGDVFVGSGEVLINGGLMDEVEASGHKWQKLLFNNRSFRRELITSKEYMYGCTFSHSSRCLVDGEAAMKQRFSEWGVGFVEA